MKQCEICKSTKNLETHHIKEQQFSDENKMIDHIYQNDKHNIVCLCRICHAKHTHNKGLIIKGWIDTDNGRILDYVDTLVEGSKEFYQQLRTKPEWLVS